MGPGEISALLAAALWAIGSLLYSRIRLSAIGISFAKNLIASVVLAVHLAIQSYFDQVPFLNANWNAWFWLGLSGILGIVVGDTFYFRSLQILGPRRALMVATTSPLFAGIGGWFFLGESLLPMAICGMLLTLGGVTGVVADRKAASESPGLFPGTSMQGVIFGVLGAIFSAIGAVASRHGLQDCEPLEASLIRILVSAVAGCLVVIAARQLRQTISIVCQWSVMRAFLPAVLCGTWLGIWLSQVAYKHSNVAIAMTLLSTTPLFATPLVRVMHGVRVSRFGVYATIVAVIGIFLTVA